MHRPPPSCEVQTSRSHTKSGRNVASRVSGGDLASMARQSPDAPASGATSSSVSEAGGGVVGGWTPTGALWALSTLFTP